MNKYESVIIVAPTLDEKQQKEIEKSTRENEEKQQIFEEEYEDPFLQK